MATLTTAQIEELKAKGLTDEKIRSLALKNGDTLPKESMVVGVAKALTASERKFGQSIAGAIGGQVLGGTKQAIEESNQRAQDIKTNLIKTIQDKRAKGQDTSKLLSALKTLDSEVNFYDILSSSTGGSLQKTGRQIFGEGLGVATDILGAGALPGRLGQVTKATTFGRGVLEGAKVGAIAGGTFGTATGVARGMQEGETTGQIVGGGIRSGLGGAVAGGAIGGVLGGQNRRACL